MKKVLTYLAAAMAVVSLAACTPSNISSAESTAVPEGVVASEGETMSLKDKPTVEYVIPEDAPTGVAGGPGVMETTAVDDSYYPEDKQKVDDTGVIQTMSEVASMDADTLIAAMVKEGILAEGTEVTAFSQEGSTASITLNQLKAVYEEASEEQILACVVNTLTENMGLESLTVKVGDKDYGTQSFTNEYDAT